jgi:hypothetical protein
MSRLGKSDGKAIQIFADNPHNESFGSSRDSGDYPDRCSGRWLVKGDISELARSGKSIQNQVERECGPVARDGARPQWQSCRAAE